MSNNPITQINELWYQLDKINLTASVISSPKAKGQIFIPRSIKYQSNDFLVASINENAFTENKKVDSITFPEDSALKIIEKNSFKYSSIKSLLIPSAVEELKIGWCNDAKHLNNVNISPGNKNYKYLDDEKKIIVGKSDKNSDNFDVIIFVNRNVKEIEIPKEIKYIESNSFCHCKRLTKIEIPDDSELLSIGSKTFKCTLISKFYISANLEELKDGWNKLANHLKEVSISPHNKYFKYLDDRNEIILGKSDKNSKIFDVIVFANKNILNVKIPNYIRYINSFAFESCNKLYQVEIPQDSELISIGKRAFAFTMIRNLFIPSKMEKLCTLFTNENITRKITLSPDNKFHKYLDEEQKVIIGKSDKAKDIFDSIVYASHDIVTIKIPKFIKFIYPSAFENCIHLELIEFEEDSQLQSIGKFSFAYTSIFEITIPKSVSTIQENTFFFCQNLEHVKIENGSKLNSISKGLFNNCSHLKVIEIPEESSIQSIDQNPFRLTLIKSIYIPSSVKYLNENFLELAKELKNIIISPNNNCIKYADDNHSMIVYKNDKSSEIFDSLVFVSREINNIVLPKFVKYINSNAFAYCKLDNVEIPEDSNLLSVEESAFNYSKIKNINFPASLEYLGNGWCKYVLKCNVSISPSNKNFKFIDENHKIIVGKSDKNTDNFDTIHFAGRDILYAKIPKNIKYINKFAFFKCKYLNNIDISDDSELSIIDQHSFSNAGIKQLKIPKSVEKLCQYSFYSSSIEVIEIEKGSKMQSIGAMSFADCHFLKTFIIPEEIELYSIKQQAFMFTMIENIYIPSSVEYLGINWCNYNRKLKKVIISPTNKILKYSDDTNKIVLGKNPPNQEKFNYIVFISTDIKDVTIPNYIEIIDNNLFQDYSAINSITIPEDSNLEIIKTHSFSYMTIENIYIPSKVRVIEPYWNFSTYNLNKIVVSPNNINFKYLDDNENVILRKSDEHSDIFDVIFFANRCIENITIPNYITVIGDEAFSRCKSLKSVKFQEKTQLKLIGENAFFSVSFTEFVIPKSVKTIRPKAFSLCRKLKSVIIENGSKIQYLADGIFNNCHSLENIEITEELPIRKIDRRAFAETPISNIYIPSSVEMIYNTSFYNCENLTNIILSPNNKYFKFADEGHKILIGKSSRLEKEFDSIININKNVQNIEIPNSIKYIDPVIFNKCSNLETIKISHDSKLKKIKDFSFNSIKIKQLFIPKNFKKLNGQIFAGSKSFVNVDISPDNPHYKFMDESKKIVLSKSDKNSNIFDSIVFVKRDVNQIFIPNYIKRIESYSFYQCSQLSSIEFQENSKLEYIGENAFSYVNIECIKIPKSVKKIGRFCFKNCLNLNKIEIEKGSKLEKFPQNFISMSMNFKEIKIPEDCSLKIIPSFFISDCNLKEIYIPPNVFKISEKWNDDKYKMTKMIISPNNNYFKNLDDDHQIVLAKSSNNDAFNELFFIGKTVKNIVIPNYVSHIHPELCWLNKSLKSIVFPSDSQLTYIGQNAFQYSVIDSIIIPKNVTKLNDGIFDSCKKLNCIEFLADSISIEDDLRHCFNIRLISFPNAKEININLNVFDEFCKDLSLFVPNNVIINDLSA